MPRPPMTFLESLFDSDPLRLLDVGARDGIDERWSRFERFLDLTAFEPDPEECERLNRGAGSLPYPARFLPMAVWREAAEVPFHVTRWPVASGVYPPNDAFLSAFAGARGLLEVQETRTIAAVSLDQAFADRGLVADCIKIDVEGAELDVLIGGERSLREALALEVEVEFNPLFRGQPLFAEVDSHLRERGWELLGLRRNSWRRGSTLDRAASGDGGQIVAADALYLNRAGGELTPGRELKLLVILSAYRQADAILARLQGGALAGQLAAGQRAELEAILVPRPGPLRRLARRLAARLDAEQRRALADSLQPGDAAVWHDPHFF